MKSFESGFDRFAGNAELLQSVREMLETGRLPHALLLEGEQGLGKQTLARLIAAGAVCTGEQKPCGRCPHCEKVFSGGHPDITVVSGSGGAKGLHVDEVRAVRQDAYVLPNEAARKVYLFPQAQRMTEQAQNALLKILEEPPRAVLFVLTCEMRAQLLPTVVSRTAILTLSAPGRGEAVRAVLRLRPQADEERILQAYEKTGGNIGRMLRLLDSENTGKSGDALETANAMISALLSSSEMALLKTAGTFERDREKISAVIDQMLLLFRDAAALHGGGKTMLSGEPALSDRIYGQLSPVQIARCMGALDACKLAQSSNPNGPLLMTRLVAELCAAAGK